ncbi:MAG: type II secretion system protein [Bacilli bacterium]|nr:type II secretion system protein [Bacilli bacterium]
MGINRKGVTLIELLAVVVILSLIMLIVIPTTIGVIEDIRNESFASTAQLMLASSISKSVEDYKVVLPANNGDATIIKLAYMRMENMITDIDFGVYDSANSYVLIVNFNGELVYYVTLQGSKRGIDLAQEGTVDKNIVIPNIRVTSPRLVGETYSGAELSLPTSGLFTVKNLHY